MMDKSLSEHTSFCTRHVDLNDKHSYHKMLYSLKTPGKARSFTVLF